MTIHPKNVRGFDGSLEELAKSIGNMAYDQTALFIQKLADDIRRQADADLARGRRRIAYRLYEASNKLYQARDEIDLAWKICKPYMRD